MLNRREVLKTVGGVAGATAAGSMFGWNAWASSDSINVAFQQDVPHWDAIGTSFYMPTLKCVFDMPTSLTPDLKIGPSIVTEYKWLDTEGKTLEAIIRPGVKFHNGDTVSSADIRFTFHERLKADRSLFLAGIWGSLISDIETPSPDRAIFHFAVPVVSAPYQLGGTSAFITPKRYFEEVGLDGFMRKPVGTGPYRMVDWQRDSRTVLEAFEDHWAGAPKIKRVNIQIIKDPSARVAAIQSGNVDMANVLPVREVVRLDQSANLVGRVDSINTVVAVLLANKGIYQDQHLRLAMHHAIDKQALSRAFFNNQAEVLSMWSGPGQAAYDPDFKFPYSVDKAKEHLAKSSYKPGSSPKVQLTCFNGLFPSDFDMGRAIVEMWKRAGMDAELVVTEYPKWAELFNTQRVETPTLFSWLNPTGDPNVYSGTLMDPRKRFSVWKSDDITPRLDPLLRETNYEKRIAGYKQLDRWIVEQGYSMPILQGTNTIVHSKRLNYVPFLNGWVLPAYWSLT